MSRRHLGITVGVSLLVVALAFVTINGRNSTAQDLRADAARILSEARTLRANTPEAAAAQTALLESRTPTTLTESDLVGVVKSVASPLGLQVEDVTFQVTSITPEDALMALNIKPTTLSDFFSVITASVKVTGDVPRLMTFTENLKSASANGPLLGIVGFKFLFDDSYTTLTVGLAGVRFNGVSPTVTVPNSEVDTTDTP
jgi:hypothetical protein